MKLLHTVTSTVDNILWRKILPVLQVRERYSP